MITKALRLMVLGLLIVGMLTLATPSYAQTVTLNPTITDSDSQAWFSGIYTITLQQSHPGTPYRTDTGQTITTSFSGTLNGSGAFTVTLTDTNFINPKNSTWQFRICPLTTGAVCAIVVTPVTAANAASIPSLLNAATTAPRITGGPFTQAYNDTEVANLPNNSYFSLTTSANRCYTGPDGSGTWGACGGGGGGGGTVTSVAQTVPSWLVVTGSPVTTSGTLAIAAATGQTSHQVIGTCGSATTFAPCALTAPDLISGSGGGTTNFLRADGTWASPTSSGVSSITGDGTIYNNSSSTGAVTLTLANTPTGTGSVVLAVSPALTGTPDASGATQFKLPVAASGASAANGEFKYDTTNLNWHAWSNGVDNLVAVFPVSALPTNGHCVMWVLSTNSYSLGDTGAACGSGSGAVNSVTNSDGTLTISPTTGSVVASLALGHANTWTAAINDSANGAASTASLSYTGTVFTGGSGTTTFPLWYMNNGATAPTGWSTNGTFLGMNAVSGFTGNFLNFWLNGTNEFIVGRTGAISTNAGLQNLASINNSTITSGTTGAVITTAVAGNVALTTNNSTASPTANLQNWQANSTTVASVSNIGVFSTPAYLIAGTTFTTSAGCSETTLTGGATGGHITVGTSSACTTVITMGSAATAVHGWVCRALDLTTPANLVAESATNATTVTLGGTFSTNDVIWFSCSGV